MTETNRYENGKIYKLVSPHTDKIYIGSTCKKYLSQRLTKHKSHYKDWLKDNDNINFSSFRLFELGDVEIILIENFNCNTKDELLKKEREYIEKFKEIIVNKQRPLITHEERKEYINKYREEHKEEIKKKVKEYREKHKEEINEKIKQKYDCICGKQPRISGKIQHEKSKYHINFISKQ